MIHLPLEMTAAAAVMVLQLVLCFLCSNYFRYVPLCLLGGLEGMLWCSYFLIRPGFYIFYMAVMGLFLLGAVLLSWSFWLLVKHIQKRK